MKINESDIDQITVEDGDEEDPKSFMCYPGGKLVAIRLEPKWRQTFLRKS